MLHRIRFSTFLFIVLFFLVAGMGDRFTDNFCRNA